MDKQLIVRLKKSERPEILTVQNSRDAKFFMANLRQIPSISHGRFRWLHCERNLALNQTYDNFGRAPHIRDRQKCKNGGYRPARDVSLEPTWHEIDAQADVGECDDGAYHEDDQCADENRENKSALASMKYLRRVLLVARPPSEVVQAQSPASCDLKEPVDSRTKRQPSGCACLKAI